MSQSPIYLDINNNKSVITALKAGEEKKFLTSSTDIISVGYVLFVLNT